MRAVQFGRDLDRQITASQSLSREFRVRRGRKEIAAESKEDLRCALMHRLNRVHRIVSVLTRRLETKFRAQLIQKIIAGLLPDAHRAIALHVAMATHRTQTRAGL